MTSETGRTLNPRVGCNLLFKRVGAGSFFFGPTLGLGWNFDWKINRTMTDYSKLLMLTKNLVLFQSNIKIAR
jgi:hypothetical protein